MINQGFQGSMPGYYIGQAGQQAPMTRASPGFAGLKRKPEADHRGDQKRAAGPGADKVIAELRALIESKCIPIARKCCNEGLSEMVRWRNQNQGSIGYLDP